MCIYFMYIYDMYIMCMCIYIYDMYIYNMHVCMYYVYTCIYTYGSEMALPPLIIYIYITYNIS